MTRNPHRGTAPLIVGEGTLVSKRDMIRALETLECVNFFDIVDKKVLSEGTGVVVKVFASKDSSTLIINGSIHVNVLTFDHLFFYPGEAGTSIVDLVQGTRTLRLIPREESSKLISRITEESYSYDDEATEDDDAVAPHILDDIAELEDDESS